MKAFFKKVDKRSRQAMIDFLTGHYRYPTMNSWNNSTSYACNMKVYNLGLEREIADKIYELIQTEDFYDYIDDLKYDFGTAHDFRWQAGFNGRNGGYLVLYQSERKPSGYKSYCTSCHQKNFTSITETGTVCGVCRQPSRVDFKQTHMNIGTFPGQSTDMYETFDNWDMFTLKDRVELVCEFDKLADDIVAEAVYMAANYTVEEETYQTTHTRKVMVG